MTKTMNAHQVKNAAIAEMAAMIEEAVANRNIEENYGEEVRPVAEYIAGWLVSNGYQK